MAFLKFLMRRELLVRALAAWSGEPKATENSTGRPERRKNNEFRLGKGRKRAKCWGLRRRGPAEGSTEGAVQRTGGPEDEKKEEKKKPPAFKKLET